MHFLIMTMLGLVLLVFAIKLMRYGRASLYWKAVEGEILSTNHFIETGGSSGSHKVNKLVVEYRYVIAGNEYKNDTISYKWTNKNVSSEREKYYAGKKLEVFVNPLNENLSVLEPGIDISNYVAIIAAIFFISAGILLAINA